LRAAGELLLEQGLGGTSIEAVSRLAGTSKATIYRWWPSKELLAVDVLLAEWHDEATSAEDTGTLAGDLRAVILPWTRDLRSRPYARIVSGLVAAALGDEDFAHDYRARFVERRRERGRAALARAAARGEIPADTDVELALDMLYGPIYHRLLHGHEEVDEPFAEQVIAAVVRAVAPGSSAG
jgi:AcrR family transcriptional regulator